MMADPWNLTTSEWSNVLRTTDDPVEVAKGLKKNNWFPWTEALFYYTADSHKILDLGSGRGELSAKLALQGKDTTLLDWSSENLDFSKRLFEEINKRGDFLQADMTMPLPFKDNTFDTVFSCGVFEYFSDEQIKNILKEAFRVSKKKVIIMVPNAFSVAYRLGRWYMEKRGRWNWGGERPFLTFKPYFKNGGISHITEFSVGAKHSLEFLKIPYGEAIKKLMICIFKMTDHSKPSLLRQGYLLMSIGQK